MRHWCLMGNGSERSPCYPGSDMSKGRPRGGKGHSRIGKGSREPSWKNGESNPTKMGINTTRSFFFLHYFLKNDLSHCLLNGSKMYS